MALPLFICLGHSLREQPSVHTLHQWVHFQNIFRMTTSHHLCLPLGPSHHYFYQDHCSGLPAHSVRVALWSLSQILPHLWSKLVICFLTLRANFTVHSWPELAVCPSLTSLSTTLFFSHSIQEFWLLCCLLNTLSFFLPRSFVLPTLAAWNATPVVTPLLPSL